MGRKPQRTGPEGKAPGWGGALTQQEAAALCLSELPCVWGPRRTTQHFTCLHLMRLQILS